MLPVHYMCCLLITFCSRVDRTQVTCAYQLCTHASCVDHTILGKCVQADGAQVQHEMFFTILHNLLPHLQESEELHADPKVQKARFPSPSSNPWGLQESDEVSTSIPTLAHPRFAAPSSNPWGPQDCALPVMGITFAPTGKNSVTYTPVEAFQTVSPSTNARQLLWYKHALLLSASHHAPICAILHCIDADGV